MKKFFAAIVLAVFALVGCDTGSSAEPNDDPAVESSSSLKSESSSSVGDSQSSSSKGPELAEESFTDARDGQTYKTLTVGTQTWMAENLNYETANSYCYNDNSANCTKYGRLYTWGAAKTACPSGWHLPDTTEWKTLFSAVGGVEDEYYAKEWNGAGTALKSTSGWSEYAGESGNGTDALGFSALPAGLRYYNGYYYYEGHYAGFWGSTEDSTEDGSDCAYFVRLYYSYDYADLNNNYKYYGFSVRCVMD